MFKMKLQEIKEGEPIVITVKNAEDAEIEYRAQVLFCKQDILFIDPILLTGSLTILDCSARAWRIACLIHHTA